MQIGGRRPHGFVMAPVMGNLYLPDRRRIGAVAKLIHRSHLIGHHPVIYHCNMILPGIFCGKTNHLTDALPVLITISGNLISQNHIRIGGTLNGKIYLICNAFTYTDTAGRTDHIVSPDGSLRSAPFDLINSCIVCQIIQRPLFLGELAGITAGFLIRHKSPAHEKLCQVSPGRRAGKAHNVLIASAV